MKKKKSDKTQKEIVETRAKAIDEINQLNKKSDKKKKPIWKEMKVINNEIKALADRLKELKDDLKEVDYEKEMNLVSVCGKYGLTQKTIRTIIGNQEEEENKED